MKLRIKGNSIRLRLLRSEVERFATDGSISDEVRFGPNALRYTVVMSPEAKSILAQFDNGEITISVPESAARGWASGEEVGFETEQPIGPDQSLVIIIEKDFVCVDRPDDPDRDDAFPNPASECGSV